MSDKLFDDGVDMFASDGSFAQTKLEDFMDEETFNARLAEASPAAVRINTPFADIQYTMQPNTGQGQEHPQIIVMSHLNMAGRLEKLMQETRLDQPESFVAPLNEQLEGYRTVQ
jgi:hypothetical protein